MDGAPGWRLPAVSALNARGFRLLYLLDAVSIYLTLWLLTGVFILLRPGFDAAAHSDRYAWTYLVIVAVHIAVFYFGGLYDRERRLGHRRRPHGWSPRSGWPRW